MRRPSVLPATTARLPRPLDEYPLLSFEQAASLAHRFKVFANPTRLRLRHALVRIE